MAHICLSGGHGIATLTTDCLLGNLDPLQLMEKLGRIPWYFIGTFELLKKLEALTLKFWSDCTKHSMGLVIFYMSLPQIIQAYM